MNTEDLAKKLRMDVIEMSHRAKAAHLGSALSTIDILSVLYSSFLQIHDSDSKEYEDRDRFILSKGHAATALYATLAYFGIIDNEELLHYGKKGSPLEEHPSTKLSGVEASTGSLGHGLPIANGISLSAKILSKKFEVYVLMSDGECNEGSVWEAAMFASKNKLDNLTAIVDFNKWQATGRSQDVLQLDPLAEKWKSFGWEVTQIDGHSHKQIAEAFSRESNGKPKLIIADTVKGKGISFMEDDNNWHYRSPNEEEVMLARHELGLS